MKPFLGIDLTENQNNEQMNGTEFLVQIPSDALRQALSVSSEKAEITITRSRLPLPFRVVQYLCGFAALLIGGAILNAEVSFAEGYRNAAWLYWTAGICAVTWGILWFLSKHKAKAVLETEASNQTFSHLEGVTQAIYQELGVPDNAKTVDVLFFFYRYKNGECKLVEKTIAAQYFNPEFKLFVDANNLYLANLEGKYAFPLSSIRQLHTVKKHIRIAAWNKEEAYNKGIYKQYKLTTDNYGCIHCKQYHILEVEHRGESFGIYIPCYELPAFEECRGDQ